MALLRAFLGPSRTAFGVTAVGRPEGQAPRADSDLVGGRMLRIGVCSGGERKPQWQEPFSVGSTEPDPNRPNPVLEPNRRGAFSFGGSGTARGPGRARDRSNRGTGYLSWVKKGRNPGEVQTPVEMDFPPSGPSGPGARDLAALNGPAGS